MSSWSRAPTDIRLIADAANGQEAVTGARATEPDLALLDVDMPKMDGIKAARLIGAVSPRTKIFMLSVHHEDDKIRAAMHAGAMGYILKDTDRSDFITLSGKPMPAKPSPLRISRTSP